MMFSITILTCNGKTSWASHDHFAKCWQNSHGVPMIVMPTLVVTSWVVFPHVTPVYYKPNVHDKPNSTLVCSLAYENRSHH